MIDENKWEEEDSSDDFFPYEQFLAISPKITSTVNKTTTENIEEWLQKNLKAKNLDSSIS